MPSATPELEPRASAQVVDQIDLPSGTVSVTDDGSGPTLLFVHAGMWSYVWRDVVRRLRPQFRCITIDFPGFGLAPEPRSDPPTLRGLATTLRELIAALGIERYTLVAHDLGGPVGLGAAAGHPDRINGLVLANTFAWEPERRALRAMLRLLGSGPMRELDAATGAIPAVTATSFGVGRRLDRPARRAFKAPFGDPERIRRFHHLMRSALGSAELFAAIDRSVAGPLATRPVLTIFGERNDPFGFQPRIAERFPDHRGIIVARGNHFPMCDDPDLFATALLDWHHTRVAHRT